MASAWGGSWAGAWGNSWGAVLVAHQIDVAGFYQKRKKKKHKVEREEIETVAETLSKVMLVTELEVIARQKIETARQRLDDDILMLMEVF